MMSDLMLLASTVEPVMIDLVTLSFPRLPLTVMLENRSPLTVIDWTLPPKITSVPVRPRELPETNFPTLPWMLMPPSVIPPPINRLDTDLPLGDRAAMFPLALPPTNRLLIRPL